MFYKVLGVSCVEEGGGGGYVVTNEGVREASEDMG